jgi:hypothetical protein
LRARRYLLAPNESVSDRLGYRDHPVCVPVMVPRIEAVRELRVPVKNNFYP